MDDWKSLSEVYSTEVAALIAAVETSVTITTVVWARA